jgi:hypothetical protein
MTECGMEALMPMQKIQKRTGFGRCAFAAMVLGVLGFSLLLAGSSRAGEIYSWQTADGNVAFTDNPKNIPARYRDQVQVRKSGKIADYARFTSGGSADAGRYADQLAERIEYLRWSNSGRDAAPAAGQNVGVAAITVSGIDMRLPAADLNAPIIIEKLRVMSSGQITTRHDTLVSQGGTPLAIVRGNQEGEVGGATNILDEEDLELYR